MDAKVLERRAGAPTSYPSDYDANSNLEFACQLIHADFLDDKQVYWHKTAESDVTEAAALQAMDDLNEQFDRFCAVL